MGKCFGPRLRSPLIQRSSLIFEAAGRLKIEVSELAQPGPGLVLVESEMSAISEAEELLIYRGEGLPEGVLGYPAKLGQAVVGRVIEVGQGVAHLWRGKRVFAFHPHESHFLSPTRDLLLLPEALAPQAAVFLPQVEMAVQLLYDGRPVIGERVAVLGQGPVGLLTVALLKRFPLGELVACESHPGRRQLSLQWGAQRCLAPEDLAELGPCDLTYELSGEADRLGQAITVMGVSGRVVIGSWELGAHFQRGSFQVLGAPERHEAQSAPGWSRERRLAVTLNLLASIQAERLITHRIPLLEAARAFEILEQGRSQPNQVVLTYQGLT